MNENNLRVLVVHNRYRSGQPSGEDRVVDQEMSLLAEAGHDVGLFERRSDDIASMSLPATMSVPLRVPWNSRVRAELRARLEADRPHIVHIHNTFPLLSPSVVAACSDASVPIVATLHNYLQVCPSGTLFRDGRVCTDCTQRVPLPAVRHGCYRDSRVATLPLTVNLVLNRRRWWSGVASFFCISDAQRAVLIQAGMPAHLLAVKRNFVEDTHQRRTGAGRHVLYLGRMSEEKGLRVLMAAWDRITARGGLGMPLVLGGTGPLAHEVARWALGRDDVRCVGLQTKEQCAALTAAAATIVAPSSWMESFGLVVVEAMAAGVPAVAAGHGAFTELICDGVSGLLHRPGDPASLAERLQRIVADPERNRAMGGAARGDYEAGFTPAEGLRALVAGYRDVIAGDRSREPV